MLSRCYRKKDRCYISYGGKGISVCKRWFSFKNFVEDVVLLDGYDDILVKKGLLALDKDKKSGRNKIYSPDTCCWITLEENSNISKNTIQISQRKFIAIRIQDNYQEISVNQSEFARKYNLTRTKINDVLVGRTKKHKGWTFYYED